MDLVIQKSGDSGAKAAAIEFLGKKCVSCGWNGDQAALQFHHLKGKDFTMEM